MPYTQTRTVRQIPRLLQSALAALYTDKGGKANTPLAPGVYALYTDKDGSESPRRSRLLDLVHAHFLTK